jgi:ribosome-binding protein aMBF1 (putative translation factor)
MSDHPLRVYLKGRGVGLQKARADLAAVLNCHPDTIRNIDSGYRNPHPDLARQIEEATGKKVKAAALVFWTAERAA